MADTATIAEYFSRVVRRGQLEEVGFRDEGFIAVPRDQLSAGDLPAESVEEIFAAHDRRKGRENAQESSDEDGREPPSRRPLPVVISLVSLADEDRGQQGLLLLSAMLHRDGRLDPQLEHGSSPWIPAQRLTAPPVSGLEVMVGSAEDFWQLSRTKTAADASRSITMRDAVELSRKLFEDVAGASIESFAQSQAQLGHQIEHSLCFIQEHDRIRAVRGLLDIYDVLARTASPPPLLDRLATGWTGARIPERHFHDGKGRLSGALQSCGSMGAEHPITASQRRSLHAFLSSESGDVTAVSGPPGTGKTTLLQSAVANLLTRHALRQEDPPIIVGTSTNNQAVTNIISSFASVAPPEPGLLDQRWLPLAEDGGASLQARLASLAVYCPSSRLLERARDRHLVEQVNKSQAFADYSEEGYIQQARTLVLERAADALGERTTLEDLPATIHSRLSQVEKLRRSLLEEIAARGRSTRFLSLCTVVQEEPALAGIARCDALPEATTLDELDELLDVTLRYAQFWLAVHYYEARWLQQKEPINPENRWMRTPSIMRKYWSQAPALTPCFVMTLFQVPQYFKLFPGQGKPAYLDEGRIDLLIVDEAGQVDAPLALPCFALAKRALVVGDENQLSPVWSIDEETDREVAGSVGIPAEEWEEELRPRGASCSHGSSLMRMASYASPWSYGKDQPGLFLAEHFRCDPAIIGFCNDLLYDGLLRPMRAADRSPLASLTSAFVRRDVPDSEDSRRGGSRINTAEAQAIAEWIVQNVVLIRDLYAAAAEQAHEPRPADEELIGVVTPFSGQAILIRQSVKAAALAEDAPEGLPERLWDLVTIGTAHRLQGAQRRIVLFSAVYGENSPQATFIDRTPELMNVAVSRAQDLFLVFAASTRWDAGPVFPVMSRFAHRSEATLLGAEVADVAEAGAGREDDASASTMNASDLILRWRDAGELRGQDEALRAAQLNPRLRDAGILEGKPGDWTPTTLASLLGTVQISRTSCRGDSFTATEFTPEMQEIILRLYRDGKL